jgi:hypothetical protein
VEVPGGWTVFDPKLRIEEHSHDTAHIVVVTYLPTGQQVSCGKYPHQVQNRTAAIELLRMQVAVASPAVVVAPTSVLYPALNQYPGTAVYPSG